MAAGGFDFAVVGAGPAGASAARRLAERGHRVVLFERQRMPRIKPCGGALSTYGLSSLGFPLPPALLQAECHGARITYRGAVSEARVPRRLAVMVDRASFDQFLVCKAQESGAEVTWAEVTALGADARGLAVATAEGTFRVKAAVIAVGARPGLTRAVCGRARDAEGLCVEADLPLTSPDRFAFARDVIDVHFGVARLGYGWVFHHGSYYSVGIGGRAAELGNPLPIFRRFVADRGLSLDGIRPRGHFIPMGVRRPLTGDRLLLAGDAAGFVDPVSGEGIAFAIRSGQLAADALDHASRDGRFDRARLRAYPRACHREFGGNLAWALRAARAMHRWPDVFLRVLASDRQVLGRLVQVMARELNYRDFLFGLLARIPVVLR